MPPNAEIVDGIKTFIPLENNPDVLRLLCENLQISRDLDFHDVITASPEFLQECPFQPCHALILLAKWPIFRAARSAVKPSIPEYNGSGPDEPVLWMKQTIGHACGLMAFLHVVFNLEGGQYVSPRFLEEAHMDAASRGNSNVPSPRDNNGYHFLAFVQKGGKVWELNGGMNGPFFRGVLGDGDDLLSERGLELTAQDFLLAAEQTGCNEMSIVAVTGNGAVPQS